jgi:diazepam-binding inhibitor (GABA receptor modulating acyl-CoA-binding protein)
VTDDSKLAAYKLYKQATVGDCNTPQPSMFSFTDRAKWNAWNSAKGMSKADAMRAYIAEIERQQAEYK